MGEGVNMISTALADVSTVFGSAVTMVTGNAVAMVFVGFALARGGLRLFRSVIHVGR